MRSITTRRSAERALDRLQVNGFALEVGSDGRYFVTRPHRGLWLLHDRRRAVNDPTLATESLTAILDRVYQ